MPAPCRPILLTVLLMTCTAPGPPALAAAGDDPGSAASVAEPARTSGPMSVAVGVGADRTTCLIGGARGGEFVDASIQAPQLHDNDPYVLYDLAGKHGEVVSVGRPRDEGSEGECASLWRQELSLDPRDRRAPVVGLHLPSEADDPLPGVLEVLGEPKPEHLELMREFLSKRSVANPEPAIIQSIRTDLDGDGTPEFILNAVRIGEERARAGDHSVLLVVHGEGRASRTYIIQDEVDVEDSEYSSTLWTNTVVGILDIDGDGTAEIITEGGFVYGGGWDVIRFDGAGFEYVLFCGCEG